MAIKLLIDRIGGELNCYLIEGKDGLTKVSTLCQALASHFL